MSTTFANHRTALQLHTGLNDSGDDTTQLNALINAAGKDVVAAFEWPELETEAYVTTPAPYSTGTIAITTALTTVTLTTGTFAAFTANTKKFALGYGQPWYYATRDSGSQLTLARAYNEDTETAATYVLYSDVLDLASDVAQIKTDSIRLHAAQPNGTLDWVPLSWLDRFDYIHGVTGRPQAVTLVPDRTSGVRRLRVWPIPDAAYVLCYTYRKGWTDLTADGDEAVISEARRDLITWHALEPAAILAEKYDLAAWAASKYERELRRAIANEKAAAPAAIQFRPFDSQRARGGLLWLDLQS